VVFVIDPKLPADIATITLFVHVFMVEGTSRKPEMQSIQSMTRSRQ